MVCVALPVEGVARLLRVCVCVCVCVWRDVVVGAKRAGDEEVEGGIFVDVGL